jgi:4-hydroxybenzoate polyprenyltransferase
MSFREYAKLCHLQTASQLILIPIVGALATQFHVGLTDLVMLFFIGLLVNIFGFTHNEYLDIEVDRASDELSTKPLVKGTVPKEHALYLAVLSIVILYVLIIFHYQAALVITVFTLSIALAAIYNQVGKKYVGVDFLLAGWAFFFCLFGALTISHEINYFVRIMALLFLFQWWYANIIEGGVKDAEHDYRIGVVNTTTALGVRVKRGRLIMPGSYKFFGLSLAVGYIFISLSPFVFLELEYFIWQLIGIGILCAAILFAAVILLDMRRFNRNTVLKMIIIGEFAKAFMPPLILVSIIGPHALLLIAFLFSWSAAFMLYEYGTTPPSI